MYAPAPSLLRDRMIGMFVGCALIATSACASAPVAAWPEDSWRFHGPGERSSDALAPGEEAPLSFVVTCEGPCRAGSTRSRVIHFLHSAPRGQTALSLTDPGILTLSNDAGLALWHGRARVAGGGSSLAAYDRSGSLLWEVPCFNGREAISSLGDVVHIPSYSPLGEATRLDAVGLVIDKSGEVIARIPIRSRDLPTWDPAGTHFYSMSSASGLADTLCCYSRSGERLWTSVVGAEAGALSPGSAVLSVGQDVVVCVSLSWPVAGAVRLPPTRRLRAYDRLSGTLLWEGETPADIGVAACAASTDGSTVYSLSHDRRTGAGADLVLRSRDGRTGRILGEVPFPGSISEGEKVELGSLAASPDGRLVSVSARVVGSEEEWRLAVYTRECDVVAETDVLEAPVTWWVNELSLAVESSAETTVYTFPPF